MRRLTAVTIVLCLCAVVSLAAAQENPQGNKDGKEKKFGTALTLTEITKISDVFTNPDKYNGKRIQVQGPIVDVCAEMGCWLALGSDKDTQVLRFKVEDGVIVFPMSVKGMKAKVEGILTVTKGPGPEISFQIKGEGAIVY